VSKHDYSPEQALDVLLRKLRERDVTLETAVRAAIDLGKDVTEVQAVGRRRVRKYRKTVPFTHEEALRLALDVLQAYFVDLPFCINSSIENLRSAAVSAARQERSPWGEEENKVVSNEQVGDEKEVEIELQTVTQISRTQQETLPLKTWEQQAIDNQFDQLKRIAHLFDFTEDQQGGDTR
jgi:hypothetical protein